MQEILSRIDKLEERLTQRHDALDSKVDDCRLQIVEVRGEIKRVEQKVDTHAATQSKEHGEVRERVASLEKSQASLRMKIAGLSAAVSLAVTEGVRRLLGGQ